MKTFKYTILDPKIGCPVEVDTLPRIKEGFIWWRGEQREVNEIHRTTSGLQMELF